MNNEVLHKYSSHAEVAAAALGSVYAVNELSKALDDEESDHYVKAAVGAAVAIGAFHQLSKKIDGSITDALVPKSQMCDCNPPHLRRECPNHGHRHQHHTPPHHSRHLLEEAAGAYAVGKEMLGDDKHHIVHLIAEAVGATGLIKDIASRRRAHEVERT